MTVVDWKVVLDIIVSLLLIATIGYAVMLNSRLSALRKNRDDLAKTIVNFNEATMRAESSIPQAAQGGRGSRPHLAGAGGKGPKPA